MPPETGTCLLCGERAVKELLDFGLQPLANRFRSGRADAEPRYPLALGLCGHCALVQLTRSAPAGQVRPRYEWLSYNEPERHLDELARVIAELPEVRPGTPVTGISSKDDSLLLRLKKLGFTKTSRLDPLRDLGVRQKTFGMETIQAKVAAGALPAGGAGGIVIARHIVEHARRPLEFARALKEFAGPKGYVVLEAPDCGRSLKLNDFSSVWEEHLSCFTAATFRRFSAAAGLPPVYFKSFPYILEDSLVSIGRARDPVPGRTPAAPEKEKLPAVSFAGGFLMKKERLHGYFSAAVKKTGPAALFGSGHPCCAFLNLFGLEKYFRFAADENHNKQGLFMPGTKLAIRRPAALAEEKIRLCLLTVNPGSEDDVLARNKALLGRDGRFSSIFPASRLALRI